MENNLNFLKENAWYKPRNSNRTRKVKTASFLKNWVKGD